MFSTNELSFSVSHLCNGTEPTGGWQDLKFSTLTRLTGVADSRNSLASQRQRRIIAFACLGRPLFRCGFAAVLFPYGGEPDFEPTT